MNFIKLKKSYFLNSVQRVSLKKQYGTQFTDKFLGLSYYYADVGLEKNKIFGVIPEKYRINFNLYTIEANIPIPPHTDSDVLTVINFYIRTSNCATRFYKIKPNPTVRQISGQTSGTIFDISSTILDDEFVAKDHEAWLLNVSVPHSVEPLAATEPVDRFGLSLQTSKYNFEQVKAMLIKSDSV